MNELIKLKQLLGITDTEKDIALEFVLADTKQRIMNYCNIDNLPQELETTMYRMAIDIYKNESIGSTEDNMTTKSISEGDTSVTFDKRAYDSGYSNSIIKSYIPQLNRFRRLVWR